MGGIAEVPRKMHLLYRNYSKCMDALPQVVNDVYDNFTSMAHLIDVAISQFDTEDYFFDYITDEVQQLIGFIRWALKWCVNEGGAINWSFVDLLADTESYFIQTLLLLRVADQQPSDLHLLLINLDDISPDFESLVTKILRSDLIFWENLEPSIFMFSEESVMKRLDQAVEDKYTYKEHRKECLFLKKIIQFVKEHRDRASWGYIYPWIECALDMMSLYFISYVHLEFDSDIKEKIDEFIHILILHILVLNSGSTPPFTDELLVSCVEYQQKFLLKFLNQRHWSEHEYAINEYKKTKQIDIIQDALSLVHSVLSHMPKHEIDYEKLSHRKKHVHNVFRELRCIISSFFTGFFVRYMTSLEISHWLCGILKVLLVLLDSDGFLSDETLIKYAYYFKNYEFQLPTNDEDIDMKSPTQDRSNFYDDLVFMARVVFYQWSEYHVERETLLNGRVEMVGVLRDLGSIICSSLNNEVEGNIQIEMNPGLPHLLAKFERVKIQFTSTIPLTILKELSARNPETDLLGFLNSLFENLEELRSDFNFVRDWKDLLQTIQGDLVVFRSFLQNIRDNSIKDDRSRDLSKRIRNFAYDAEYIIHSFFAGFIHVCCRSFIIFYLIEEGNLIKEKANAKEIIIEGSTHVLSQDLVPTTNPKKDVFRMSSRASIPPTDVDVVVGFKAEKRLMMECLASDQKQLDVISIVGMGGIGKTTLAKKVYEDPYIVNHFQHRAWSCVSQEYVMKTLLLSVLGTDGTDQDNCEDLSLMLHKKLKGRKYLIVLDDVWDIDVFYELKRCFPNDDNGSRVVLTTRTISVGLQAKHHSDPIELHPLSDDESWNLLKQKVFPEQECPMELFQIGKKIVRKCGGLPLAVVVVAGILAKSDKKQYVWEEVAERLDIYTYDDSQGEMSMKALDLSYEFLPDHLKPLFLYVGAFPEDHNIRAKNLKWLWIAEGFIRGTEKMSLEVQAETYLMDLVDRNLLMVAERSSSGSVKTCGIHDVMRDMSLAKAKAENFMQRHNIEGIEYLSEQHLIYPRRVSLSLTVSKDKSAPTPSTTNEALPPHPLITYEELSRLSMTTRLNSILLFGNFIAGDERCKSIFQNHKMLRVFHTEMPVRNYFPTNVTPPVHLRYISVGGDGKIRSSVFRLWSLETLIVNGSPVPVQVSGEVWYMTKLRHLHINNMTTFEDPVDDSRKLENLQTLSTPIFRGEETKLIGRFPNLKKLRCSIKIGSENIFELPRLESLHLLESVKVSWYRTAPCRGQFSLPSTLKKLSLFHFRFQWKDIANFQELPNLEILKLGVTSVEDALWDMGDGEFPKLKFLMLRDLNIIRWIASRENFPCLHNLVLHGCRGLEDIPSGLGDICSLEKIEAIRCSHSASESAKRIHEEQEEMGNELKVYISDPMSDSDSE